MKHILSDCQQSWTSMSSKHFDPQPFRLTRCLPSARLIAEFLPCNGNFNAAHINCSLQMGTYTYRLLDAANAYDGTLRSLPSLHCARSSSHAMPSISDEKESIKNILNTYTGLSFFNRSQLDDGSTECLCYTLILS